jgi:hypothetical protein
VPGDLRWVRVTRGLCNIDGGKDKKGKGGAKPGCGWRLVGYPVIQFSGCPVGGRRPGVRLRGRVCAIVPSTCFDGGGWGPSSNGITNARMGRRGWARALKDPTEVYDRASACADACAPSIVTVPVDLLRRRRMGAVLEWNHECTNGSARLDTGTEGPYRGLRPGVRLRGRVCAVDCGCSRRRRSTAGAARLGKGFQSR